MLAEHFVFGVPFDTLGTGIPTRHMPFWIECVDGIIDNTVHTKSEVSFALSDGLLVSPRLRHVTSDFREADELTVFIQDWINNDAGPELGSVFADPPSFLVKSPGTSCGGECLRRLAGSPVLGRKEQREMPAENILGGVAFCPLSPCIPSDHDTVRIETVDRIVGDCLDKQAELTVPGDRFLHVRH